MSVAGILDAMRSDRPLSERLVWMCLENHANGARFWSISIDDMAGEIHVNRGTVVEAVKRLERDRIIRCERRHRRTTTYFMIRDYGPEIGIKEAEHESEIRNQNPDLGPEIDTNDFRFESEFPDVVNPPVRINPPERKKESRHQDEKPEPTPTPASEVAHQGELIAMPPPKPPATTLDDIAAAWCSMAAQHGLPPIRIMTAARKRSLAARVAEVGIAGMMAAIQAVSRSPFCLGENETNWRADFDFLLQPKSLIRLIEGRYSRGDRRSKWDQIHSAIGGQGSFLTPQTPSFLT